MPPQGARRIEWQPTGASSVQHIYEYRHDGIAGELPVVYWFNLVEDAQGQFVFNINSASGDVFLALQKGVSGKNQAVPCQKMNENALECSLLQDKLLAGEYFVSVISPKKTENYRLFAGARLRRPF